MINSCLLSLVTVTYKPDFQMFDEFLKSFRKYNDLGSEAVLYVVDNSPIDSWNSDYFRKKYPEVTFISNPDNPGFGASNNLGASISNSEYILFVNNDVEFCECIFKRIIDIVSKVGNFGCATIYAYGGSPSVFIKPDRKKTLDDKYNEVDYYLSGAFLFFKRQVFDNIGQFDSNLFMYFEEYDISERLLAKRYKSLYIDSLSFIHKTGNRRVSSLATYKNLITSGRYLSKKYDVKFRKQYFLRGPLKFLLYDLIKLNFKLVIHEFKILTYLLSNINDFTK